MSPRLQLHLVAADLGWSTPVLARALGVPERELALWLMNMRPVPDEHVGALADALELAPERVRGHCGRLTICSTVARDA